MTPEPLPIRALLRALPAADRQPALEADLRRRVARILGLAPSLLDRDRRLTGLGLDSLTAVQLQYDLETTFGMDVPLADLIDGPTLAELALELARQLAAERDEPPRPPAAAAPGGARELPLSYGQRALWFIEGLAAGGVYNVAVAGRVRGRLDPAALQASWNRLAARHPALRTTFHEHRGQPVQRIHEQLPVDFTVEAAAGWSSSHLQERLAAEARRPFDLAAGPLVRLQLFAVAAEETVVLLVVHHLVVDFWSIAQLVRELDRLYREATGGAPAALPPLAEGYGDYVAWQEELLAGPAGERLWQAWRRQLAGEPPTLDLPTDRPRPPVQAYRGAVRLRRLDRAATAALHGLARAADATSFAALLAIYQAFLGRHSGQREVWVGSPTLGRPRPELLELVGYFVNPVVLRGDLDSDPGFDELLRRARRTLAAALRHQDFPFAVLTERLKPVRDPSRSPLFQAMLVLQQAPRSADPALAAFALAPGVRLPLGGFILESEPIAWRAADFDLSLIAAEVNDRLWLALEYDTDLFDATTAERWLSQLEVLIAGVAACPRAPLGRLPLLPAPERQQVQVEWPAGPGSADEESTVHALFEEQAVCTPDAIAVVAAGECLSYGELDLRATRLARRLARRGVGPESRVALIVERSLFLPIGLLGILKAGGAYVPVDPAYPAARQQWLLADAAAVLVVTQTSLAAAGRRQDVEVLCLDQDDDSGPAADRPVRPPAPGNPAYVIYTSGSTGRPKGVVVAHRSIAAYTATVAERLALAPGDRMLQFTSISFDTSAEEIYSCLARGATLVLRDEQMLASIPEFLRAVAAWEITHLDLPTAFWHEICAALVRQDLALPASLRLVVVGGEQVLRDRTDIWSQRAAGVQLVNTYGPTETTVVAVWCGIDRVAADPRVPIGRPIPGGRCHVLGPGLEPCPIGATGELYLGGTGVARGYLDRPDQTAERFVPDSWSDRPGSRLYRTGDLARWRADGTLEFLGRTDEQVKVRGFRIELGEIEIALREHPGVAEGVVLATPEASGGRRLTGFVVPHLGATPAVGELRSFLAERLPDYMIPTSWRVLTALPLTPNGKLDRQALAALPDRASNVGADRSTRPPASPTEEVVAGICGEILGHGQVDPADNFFEIGGHSLLATQVVSRLREVFHVDLLLRNLFEHPTAAGLARLVERAAAGAALAAPPIGPLPRSGPIPLSFAQERLWFLALLEPGNPWYNLPAAVHAYGPLAPPVLAASLGEVVRRHEVLRSCFAGLDAGPVQVVAPAAPFRLPVVDLSTLPPAARPSAARRLATDEGRRPFDLAQDLMLRAVLLQLAPRESMVLVTLHHIAADGWSMVLFVRELSALYGALAEGNPSPLPEPAIQYGDFARWQRRWLAGEPLDRQLVYWRDQLAGAPLLLDLPTDRPRGIARGTRGARQPFALPAALDGELRALGRRQGATLFMVLLATFQAYLGRCSGQDDVLVGVPIAGRNRRETEGLIGLFVNTLVMRTRLAGAPGLAELLVRVRNTALEAYAHQDLPFERLVEDLQPARSLAHTPLFQVMLAFENAPATALELAGLTLDLVELDTGTAKFDLHLTLTDAGGGLAGYLEYRSDLFDAPTAARMVQGWLVLLGEAVARPGSPVCQLPLLTVAEHHQLLEWNGTAVERSPGLCLHHLFADQAARRSDATALIFADQSLSYGLLALTAGHLARHLRRLGVGPEVVVGVFAERSLEMVIALLAILEAGGAYLPLDPDYPVQRLAMMLEDARAPVLLVQEKLAGRLPAHGGEVVVLPSRLDPAGAGLPVLPATAVDDSNLAYVIFTSGSTGRPKGAMNTHCAIVNRLLWMQAEYGLATTDRVLQKTPFSFDVSVWELFWPLLAGACLVVAQPGEHRDPESLVRTIVEQGVTTLHFVPSLLQLFVATPGVERCSSLQRVMASGEALPYDLQQRFFARPGLGGAALYNLYGPTEAAVDVTSWDCAPDGRPGVVPIGRPVANTAIHLLDRDLAPVPVGVAGELYIGGVQLARGYFDRPALTAERFVPAPCGIEPGSGPSDLAPRLGARLYRTGDLARRLPAGEIEYLGRLDHQVKIRGFRIELGEIETMLASHPAVRDAIVLAREDRPGDLRLVAYVTPVQDPVDAAALRTHLAERLPAYMVPAHFVPLATLPLSANGKVERRALPPPEPTPEVPHKPADDPLQEIIAGIWSEVLGRDGVGVKDDFFALGGHSLLVIRVLSRLRQTLGVELAPRALFEAPTVAALARTVAAARGDGRDLPSSPPLVPVSRAEALQPSFAQERLWIMDQLLQGSAVFNIAQALCVRGRLDEQALARSLAEVVRRHEVLRCRFSVVRGRPLLVIEAEPRFELPRIDLTALPPARAEQEALRLAQQEAQRPFDLLRGPLLRASVVRAASTVLLLSLHHTVCDDWSVGLLVQEVAALYCGLTGGPPPRLPVLPVQYADYAAWQRGWLVGEVLEAELAYWRRQLQGELPVLALPTDRARPPVQSYRGARRPFMLQAALVADLDALGRHQGVTLFMILLAGFAAVLGRASGQEDVVIGAPIAGRNRREIEDLIGCFINILPLRIDLSGQPHYRTLLERVRQVTLGAFDHRDVPFEKLIDAVQVKRSLAHAALRQVALALQDESMRPVELGPGLTAEPLAVESGVARLDLTLFLWRTAGGLSGDCEYSTDLFDGSTIDRLLGFLTDVLAEMAAGIDRPIALMPPLIRREIADPCELGEIEGVLTRFPGVRKALVLREDHPGDPRLVAYYVPEPGWGPSAKQLRGYLEVKLPQALVPSELVPLATLPPSPAGQIDPPGLPSPPGG